MKCHCNTLGKNTTSQRGYVFYTVFRSLGYSIVNTFNIAYIVNYIKHKISIQNSVSDPLFLLTQLLNLVQYFEI